jgi:hypothetical protein
MGTPDQLILVRGAISKALKASPDLLAFVPAASVFHGTVPASRTFPFTRIGSIISSPFRTSCLDSSAYRIMVQGFAKSQDGGFSGEDAAMAIGNAFKAALDGQTLSLANGMKLRTQWVQTIPTIDGDDPAAWMVTSIITGEVAG